MTATDRRYAPHNGARIYPLTERAHGVPIARAPQSRYQLAHAEPGEPVIQVDDFRRHGFGRGERWGVRVTAHAALRDGQAERDVAHTEIVWGTEKKDPTVRNRIGQLGAYVDVAPSTDVIDAAITRAAKALTETSRRDVTT